MTPTKQSFSCFMYSGYISPEYAMHGYFSVKSDVFSFGIMVLEIISGKRKGCSSESECIDDIRRYVSTQYLRLLFTKLKEWLASLANGYCRLGQNGQSKRHWNYWIVIWKDLIPKKKSSNTSTLVCYVFRKIQMIDLQWQQLCSTSTALQSTCHPLLNHLILSVLQLKKTWQPTRNCTISVTPPTKSLWLDSFLVNTRVKTVLVVLSIVT